MIDSLVALENVSKSYEGGRIAAIRNVTLQIERRTWLSIIGRSGSGKSTLLHLIGGLDRPTEGVVVFDGHKQPNKRLWARLRAEKIGFIFQAFNLLPTLTALENVEVPMIGVTTGSTNRCQRALKLLQLVGLADRHTHYPGKLSGGERQRVAIARALANSPDLLIADEPTGNLDSKTSQEIMDLLAEIHTKEKTTLIVVTHEPQIAGRAQQILSCNDGRLETDP